MNKQGIRDLLQRMDKANIEVSTNLYDGSVRKMTSALGTIEHEEFSDCHRVCVMINGGGNITDVIISDVALAETSCQQMASLLANTINKAQETTAAALETYVRSRSKESASGALRIQASDRKFSAHSVPAGARVGFEAAMKAAQRVIIAVESPDGGMRIQVNGQRKVHGIEISQNAYKTYTADDLSRLVMTGLRVAKVKLAKQQRDIIMNLES